MGVARHSIPILALVLFASPRVASGDDLFLKSRVVRVEGIADITAGRVADARKAAIANAQRSAVERVLGSMIESSFSAHQKEQTKNQTTGFMSTVQESVKSNARGYIDGYDLVTEQHDEKLFRVTLDVRVKSASLAKELEKLRALLGAVGYPKVMLVAGERVVDAEGRSRSVDRPTIVTLIEDALLERGFTIVDKARVSEPSTLGDAMRAAEVARRYGAEVAVVGSAEVEPTGFNEFDNGMFYVSAVVNMRAVNASTGKVLTSFEAIGKGAGASEDLARVKAIRGAAPELIDNLLTRLVHAWRAEVAHGKRFRLNIVRVRSYGREARPFIKALRALPAVRTVKELGYENERLELEVIFKGTKEELLEVIFDRVASTERFANLDKTSDRGDEIGLKL